MEEEIDIFEDEYFFTETGEKCMWEGIFQDISMLDPEYIPHRLIARDEQIKQVASIFRPMLIGGAPHNAMIYGLTGTGKSVVIRYVLKKLNQKFIEKGIDRKVNLVSAKCNVTCVSKVLQSIVAQLDPRRAVPQRGVMVSKYIDDILDIMNETGESLVLVLDEFDKLPQSDILYPLVRAGEQETLKKGVYISIIGISNDIYYYSTLDPRIISSMGARSLVFRSYFAPELIQILEGRLDAFKPGSLDDEVIPYCAAIAAQERGDAREAIRLLRGSGGIADERMDPKVTIEHVRLARELLDRTPDYDAIKALSQTHKMGLCAYVHLKDAGKVEIESRDLYDRYTEVAKMLDSEYVSMRRFSSVVNELEMIGIVTAELKSRGRYGKTRVITLVPTVSGVKSALRRDPQFGLLLEPAPGKTSSQSNLFGADLIK